MQDGVEPLQAQHLLLRLAQQFVLGSLGVPAVIIRFGAQLDLCPSGELFQYCAGIDGEVSTVDAVEHLGEVAGQRLGLLFLR